MQGLCVISEMVVVELQGLNPGDYLGSSCRAWFLFIQGKKNYPVKDQEAKRGERLD